MFGVAEPRLSPLAPGASAWRRAFAAAVSVARLRRDVEALAAPRGRLHAPAAMERATQAVVAGFQEAGWPAERQPYTFFDVTCIPDHGDRSGPRFYSRLDGANVVAARPGAGGPLVVAAHLDTVEGSPGADDNAAGVAALLELARLLAAVPLRRAVILAALDMEELGFFGARALLASQAVRRRPRAAIVFETMAYTSPEPGTQVEPAGLATLYRGQAARLRARGHRGEWTAALYRRGSAALAGAWAEALTAEAGADAAMLLRDPLDLPGIGPALGRALPAARDFARSDHVPFWETGIPAILVTDTANFRNPHYHGAGDTPETLDYQRLAQIVVATAVTVVRFGRPDTAIGTP